ncbi:MAG: hypothetical protein IJX99_08655 [Clostridia bacterium]|nr:hypothetical protein [Clostridia bacterium]
MLGKTNATHRIDFKPPQIVNYIMLYDYGDECIDVTGGWENTATYVSGQPSSYSGAYTENENNIYVYGSGSTKQPCAGTSNMVDVTGYIKAYINWNYQRGNTTYGWNRFGCGSVKNEPMYTGNTYGIYSNQNNVLLSYSGLSSFDIPDGTTEAYFQMNIQSNSSSGWAENYMYHCFLVRADDWQTLASLAGISASSIDDILTNSSTLLSNEEAVKFMIYNCTGDFMVSAIQNNTFLTALNNSQYKTKIYANKHWSKFLSMIV